MFSSSSSPLSDKLDELWPAEPFSLPIPSVLESELVTLDMEEVEALFFCCLFLTTPVLHLDFRVGLKRFFSHAANRSHRRVGIEGRVRRERVITQRRNEVEWSWIYFSAFDFCTYLLSFQSALRILPPLICSVTNAFMEE